MPVVSLISKYVGVPYRHLGRDMSGLDCWGLPKLIYMDHGVEIIDLDNYSHEWVEQGADHFLDNCVPPWIQHAAPVYLDVMLFRIRKKIVSHAGIFLSHDKFIQCGLGVGVVVTDFTEWWKERLEGYFRYDTDYIRS